MTIVYHIFTNNHDEYTKDKTEAYRIYHDFVKEYGNARLYEEERDSDDELINESCIESTGAYPL